jgi:purine-binding chemotaxis protein CheW
MAKKMQYLTFLLADELFAIEVLNVKEIIPKEYITFIPMMQPFIEGVMNIRGNVVPIVSLDKRIGLDKSEAKKESIIIVTLDYKGVASDVGLIVSEVNRVFEEEETSLDDAPAFGTKIKRHFIKNIAKVDEKFIPILDIEKVLNLDEISKTLQDS